MKNGYITTRIWHDAWFETLPPEQKLLFIYLRTNGQTSICGIFELTNKTIAYETGIHINNVCKYMSDFERKGKVYRYNEYICITNMLKHLFKPNDNLIKGVQNEKSLIDAEIIHYFEGACKGLIRGSRPPSNISPSPSPSPSPPPSLLIPKGITEKSEPLLESEILKDTIIEELPKEKSSARKEKVSYGDPAINQMLEAIKGTLKLTDFKESVKMQRIFGKHLVGLKETIGDNEFKTRFLSLMQDSFHLKNMGSLQYCYKQIKGFVSVESKVEKGGSTRACKKCGKMIKVGDRCVCWDRL